MIGTPRDDERFEREALRWLPDLTRFAVSLTRSEVEAEDLVQSTFLIALERWNQYVPGTECRAWLFTLCRNHFFRANERAKRSVATEAPELEALAAAAIHAAARRDGLEDSFERREVLDAVDAAIASLPVAFREVALLVDVHDHSYVSASAVMGVPIGTVRSRLFRARRLLQEKLLIHARDAGIGTRADNTAPRETLS